MALLVGFDRYSSSVISVLGSSDQSYSLRPFAPPYAKVRAMPMAPIASRRSASWTIAASIEDGRTPFPPLKRNRLDDALDLFFSVPR
ncbi:hypothetical protein FK545_18945 [Planococcus glaciei]|nr:hypothetical protein FK545_18945 [Planococcus glaciei]